MKRAWAIAAVVLLAGRQASAQEPPEPDEPEAPPPEPPEPPGEEREAPLEPVETPPEPETPPARFFSTLEAGYSHQSLYGIGINGLDMAVSLGADCGNVEFGAIAEGALGWTTPGLQTSMGTIGMLVEGRMGRFHLGGGTRLGYFQVTRVTTGDSLSTPDSGVFLRLSVDLLRWGDEPQHVARGLFFVVKGSADFAGATLPGLGAGLGARF